MTSTTKTTSLFLIIYLWILSSTVIFVNCAEIQIEDYCDGPICEYLLWKIDQDHVDTTKQFPKKLLYFRNSVIPKLPIEILNVYPDLKQLSISNAYIDDLPDNMASQSLEFLFLSNNKIKIIRNDAFKLLPNLKYLWLNSNEIESLEAFAFDSLDNLLFLELSNNEITELPEGLFKNTPKLTSLFLSRNKISTLPDGLFDSNPNLYQLNIDNNNLITIADNIFKEIKILHILDISFNPIRTLNLVNVNIEKFISNSSNLIKLSFVGTVKQLDFTKTPIKQIELTEPEKLKILTLHECYLRDLNMVESFNKLRILNVSSNPFIKLENESLQPLKYLEILSIANCDLSNLEVEVFAAQKNLKYLDISNNKIEEINLDTLRHMRDLKNISITENHWNCCSLKQLIKWLEVRSISFKEEPKLEQSNGVYLNGINCVV